MISDKIENSGLYECINPLFKKAFGYIKQADFSKMEPGKQVIEGDSLFAIIQEYNTKSESEAKLEAHRKYIDIQYVISGEEQIGIRPLIDDIPSKEYDVENDFALFDGSSSFIKVSEGQFSVLFPQDLHKPGIRVGTEPKRVKKVVIKVLFEGTLS